MIDTAEHEIDMAAYVLTDWPVMQALTRAADHGVKVRIYLDGTQFAEREPAKVFYDLALSASGISRVRELRRNRLPSGRYSPLHAAGAYQLRRRRRKHRLCGEPRYHQER